MAPCENPLLIPAIQKLSLSNYHKQYLPFALELISGKFHRLKLNFHGLTIVSSLNVSRIAVSLKFEEPESITLLANYRPPRRICVLQHVASSSFVQEANRRTTIHSVIVKRIMINNNNNNNNDDDDDDDDDNNNYNNNNKIFFRF